MSFGFARFRQLILEQLESRVVFDAAPGAELLVEPPAEEPPAQLLQVRTVDDAQQADVRTRRELVVIDAAVEDIDTLLDAVQASSDAESRHLEVLLLDPGRSGLDQLTETLAGYSDLDAIHLLSHGDDAAIRLGTDWLTADSLSGSAGQVSGWGGALAADGDFLLYGCDIAESAEGRQLVDSIAALTGADVAASTNDTGDADRGGDWSLEYATGAIESRAAISADGQAAYGHTLAVGASVSTVGGSSREVFLGDDFSFTIRFENTGAPTETGYAPFFDLYFPTSGPDGTAGQITEDVLDDLLDGLTFEGADGYIKKVHVLTFGDDDGATTYDALGNVTGGAGTTGTIEHPFAEDGSGPVSVQGTTGDTLVVLELNFGSLVPGQPGTDVTVRGSLSGLADLGDPLAIRMRGGFRYGTNPLDDPGTDPVILSDAATDARTWNETYTVTPKLFDLTGSDNGTGEAVTGPNFPHTYRTQIRLPDGESLENMAVTIDLPDDIIFQSFSVSGATFASDNAGSLSTTAPQSGAQLVLTGGNSSAQSVVVNVTYFVPETDAAAAAVIPTSGAFQSTSFNSSLVADWTPTDTRDEGTPGNVVATLAGPVARSEKSINVQRGVSRDGGGQLRPGDVIRHDINFQISDYFTFDNLRIEDVLSDGQLFPLMAETLQDGSGSANERQRLAGTNLLDYTISFGGATTGTISRTATASQVRDALVAGTSLTGADVVVTGSNTLADPFIVEFTGAEANVDQSPLMLRPIDSTYAPTLDVTDRFGAISTVTLTWRFADEPDNGEAFVIDRSDMSRTDDAGETGQTGVDGTDGSQTVTVHLSQALRDAAGSTAGYGVTLTQAADATPGAEANERQQIDGIENRRFALGFGGESSTILTGASSAADVQAALERLSGIGAGDVLVTGDGTSGDPFIVEFTGALAQTDVADLDVLAADGILAGGNTQPGDTETAGGPAATGTLTYYTVVQDEFADDFSTSDRSVDQGDSFSNAVTIFGDVRQDEQPLVDVTPGSPITRSDAGAAGINVARGQLSTGIYAINGSTTFGSPVEVTPGDEVTYRLTYELPSSDFEQLRLTDFLPLPIFEVDDPDADGVLGTNGQATAWVFDNAANGGGVAPASGTVRLGPGDTFYRSRVGDSDYLATGDISIDADRNAISFDFGNYDDPASVGTTIELLMTVTVNDEPFTNGLSLTNLVESVEANTTGTASSSNEVQNVRIKTPELELRKGIVSVDSPRGAVTTPGGASVIANEQIVISGQATNDYVLSINGAGTNPLPATANAAAIRTELVALFAAEYPSLTITADDVIVTGGPGTGLPIQIRFADDLARTSIPNIQSNAIEHTETEVVRGAGETTNEVQYLSDLSSSFVSLSINGETTGSISASASAADVRAALAGTSYLNLSDFTLVGNSIDDGPIVITYDGVATAGTDVADLTTDSPRLQVAITTDGAGNEVHTISIKPITLTVNGETTAPLPGNATAAQVQAAIEALPGIGAGNVAVTGGSLYGGAVAVAFQNDLAGVDIPPITSSSPLIEFVPEATASVDGSNPFFGGVVWNDPGSGTAFSGTITSANLDVAAIDGNAAALDAGDRARVAISVENIGDGPRGAFDITLSDTLPDGARFVTGSLQVLRGDGTALPFTGSESDFFADGITIDDPGPMAGALAAYDAGSGANILVVVYDVIIDDGITVETTLESEATLINYAARESGKNYITSELVANDQIADAATLATRSPLFGIELIDTELPPAMPGDPSNIVNEGELATYRLAVQVPEGRLDNAVLTAALDEGLAVVSVDSVTMSAGVTSEQTFTLGFGGDTTAALTTDATAAEVQAALEALESIGAGNVVVTGGPATEGPLSVTFTGSLAGTNVGQIVSSDPVAAVSTTTPGGGSTDEVQQLAIGAYQLRFGGQNTGLLYRGDDAATVQAALRSLGSIGGANVVVTGSPLTTGSMEVAFTAGLANTDVGDITVLGSFAATGVTVDGGDVVENDRQRLSRFTEGGFTLSFGGQTTDPLVLDATADDVRQALESLSSIGEGNVLVTGGPADTGTLTVEFIGALAGTDVAELTAGQAFVDIATTVPGGGGNEQQTIDVGRFTLSYGGTASTTIRPGFTAAQVQAALESIAALAGNVTVTDADGAAMGSLLAGDLLVDFGGALAGTDALALVTSDPLTSVTTDREGSTTPTDERVALWGGADRLRHDAVTVSGSGRDLSIDLGTLVNRNSSNAAYETVVVEFTAVARESVAAGDSLDVTGALSFDAPDALGRSETAMAVPVNVVEPSATVAVSRDKAVAETDEPVLFTLTITGGQDHPAYDMALAAVLAEGLNIVPGTLSQTGGPAAVAGSLYYDADANAVVGRWDELTSADTVTITFEARPGVIESGGYAQYEQSLSVDASIAYTSMPGDESATRSPHVTDGHEATRTDTASASITVAIPTTSFVVTETGIEAADQIVAGNGPNDRLQATIGETITYRGIVTLPDATAENASFEVFLDEGVEYQSALANLQIVTSGVATDAAGGFAAVTGTVSTVDGKQKVTFDLGNLTDTAAGSDGSIAITFTTVLANDAANVRGETRTAQGRFDWDLRVGGDAGDRIDSDTVTVLESRVTNAQTVRVNGANSSASNLGDAGDAYEIRYTIENRNETNRADAYDVTFFDSLPGEYGPADLTRFRLRDASGTIVAEWQDGYAANGDSALGTVARNSGTVADITMLDAIIDAFETDGQNVQTKSGQSFDLAYGYDVLFEIDGTLTDAAVNPDEIRGNNSRVRHTTLDGTNTNERGSETSNVSNYFHNSGNRNLFIAPITAEASLFDAPGSESAGANVVIGETVRFAVRMQIPEGTTQGLTLIGDLPDGIDFTGASLITSAAASRGLLAEDFAAAGSLSITGTSGAAAGSGDDITVTLSNFTLTGEDAADEADDNAFLVIFTGTVANETGAKHIERGDDLGFAATYDYNSRRDSGLASATDSVTAPPSVTVIEPELAITSSQSITAGDAGDAVTYTFDLTHTAGSDADAHDVVFTATAPAGIDLSSATVVVSRGLEGGSLATLSSSGMTPDYTYNHASGTITIAGIGQLDDGDQLRIAVTGEIAGNVAVSSTIPAFTGVQATWSSLDDGTAASSGERHGGAGSQNDYAATGSTSAITIGDGAYDKVFFGSDQTETAGSAISLGETAEFALVIDLPEGRLASLDVRDRMPPGLIYTGHRIVTTAADSGGLLTADWAGTAGAGTVPTIDAVANLSDPGQPFAAGHDVLFTFDEFTTTGDNVAGNNRFLLIVQVQAANATGSAADYTNAADFDPTGTETYEAGNSDKTAAVSVIVPNVTLAGTLAVSGDGDADDTATLTFTATNSGSADAYDVVITDDLSGLPLDNITSVTVPTGWTFSSTGGVVTLSADANTKIDAAGGTVSFSFTADLTHAVQAGGSYDFTGAVAYSTFEGSVTGEFAGTADSNTLTHTVDTPTLTKTLTGTTIDQGTGPNERFEAVIGEELTYEIVLAVPEGQTTAAVITDQVSAGLVVDLASITVTPSSGVTTGTVTTSGGQGGSGTGGPLTINLGTVNGSGSNTPADETVTITYRARVANTDANDSGDTLGDTAASLAYTSNVATSDVATAATAAATIIEPSLSITQSNDFSASKDAADPLAYTIVISNTGAADAHDLSFLDDLPIEFDLTSFTAVKKSIATDASLGDVSAQFTSGTIGTTDQYRLETIANANLDLAVGEKIEIVVSGTLRTAEVSPGEVVNNTASVQWTSLDDTGLAANGSGDERTGTGSPARNGYAASDDSDFTVRDPGVVREIIATGRDQGAETTADPKASIGETITYRVRITLPESTTTGAEFVDVLDEGLRLVPGSVSFNPDADITRNSGGSTDVGFVAADIVSTAIVGDRQTITFDFDTLANGASDPNAEVLEFTYTVVVLDDSGTTAGDTLSAAHSFDWNEGGPVTGTAAAVDVIEPNVDIAQTITVNGTTYDNPSTLPSADAGDIVSYTFTIDHNAGSTADAFDLAFASALPAELDITAVTAAHSDTATHGTGTNNLGAAVPAGQAVGVGGFDLTIGETVTVTVTGTLRTALTQANETIANAGTVTWTSLDAGDTGDGSTAADAEQRDASSTPAYTETSDTESLTIDGASLAKSRISTSVQTTTNTAGQAVVGESVTYRLAITVPEGITEGVSVTDLLPAGTLFDASSVVWPSGNPSSSLQTVDTSVAGQVTFNLGTITNAASSNGTAETFVIEYDVIVANVAGNQQSTAIAGTTATLSHTGAADDTDGAAGVAVIEPVLVTSQSLTINGNSSPGETIVADAGDAYSLVITIDHATGTGGSQTDAFDLVYSQALPAEIDLDDATITVSGGTGTAVVDTTGNVLTVTGLDLAPPDDITITITNKVGEGLDDLATPVDGGFTVAAGTVSWTSLDGAETHERDGADGVGGSLDDYAATSNTAAVTTPAASFATSLHATSEAATAGSTVAVGETVTYAIDITLPEGTTDDLIARLALPPGLEYVSIGTDLTGYTGTTPTPVATSTGGSGDDVTIRFGTQTTTGNNVAGDNTFKLLVTARVVNEAGVDAADVLAVTAVGDTDDELTTDSQSAGGVSVTVAEPRLAITQSVTLNGTTNPTGSPIGDAGDAVTYTYNVAHVTGTGGSTADAWSLVFTDTLPDEIDLSSAVVKLNGSTVTPTIAGQAVTVDGFDLSQTDGTATITIEASLKDAEIDLAETVTNDAAAVTWTSLDGTSASERTGSESPAHNDYRATSNVAAFATDGTVSVSEHLVSTSASHTAGGTVAVGETVRLAMVVTLPEGRVDDFVLRQTLPPGLAYIGSSLATTDAGDAAGLLAGDFSGSVTLPTPTTTGGDITFDFGRVAVTGDNDVNTNSFVVFVDARVQNVAGVQAAALLGPAVTFDVDDELATDSQNATGVVSLTVAEPALTVSQTVTLNGATNPTGSPVGDAGDAVTYTYNVAHVTGAGGSTADAFDLVLTDTLPDEIDLSSAVVRLNGSVVTPTIAGQTVTVDGFDLSQADGAATITVEAVLADATTNLAETVTNDAAVVTWTSLDGASSGERTGSQSPAVNDYRATSNVATFTTSGTVTVVESLLRSSESHTTGGTVVVGEEVTLAIAVSLPEGTITDFVLRESLPPGLTYLGSSLVTDAFAEPSLLAADFAGSVSLPTPSTASGAITFDFGDIVVTGDNDADTNTFVILVNAEVANVAAVQNLVTLAPSVTFDTDDELAADSRDATGTVSLTVAEPDLAITQTVTLNGVTNGDGATGSPIGDAGDAITYTYVIDHTAASTARASDLVFTADLPTEADLDSAVVTVTGGTGTSTVSKAGNRLTVSGLDLGPADDITITVAGTLQTASTSAGETISTTAAAVTWTSLDGTSHERTGSGSPAVNDYAAASGTTAVAIETPSFVKTLVSSSVSSAANGRRDVVIGETVRYRLAVTVPDGTTDLASIIDTLDAGHVYAGNLSVSLPTGVTSDTTIAASTATVGADQRVSFDLGTITNAGNTAAGEVIVIEYDAIVRNVTGNQSGDVLGSSASLSYNRGGSVVTLPVSSPDTVTVREPVLTVTPTVSDATPHLGDTVTVTLAIDHAAGSNADAHQIRLTDTLPPELRIVAGTLTATSGTLTDNSTAGSLDVTLDGLSDDGSATIRFDVLVSDLPADFGDTLSLDPAMTWTSLPTDPAAERTGAGGVDDYRAAGSTSLSIVGADLAVTIDDMRTDVDAGDEPVYRLTIRNNGTDAATGVVVSQTLPPEVLTFISASPAAGVSVNPTMGVLTWNAGTLAVNGIASIDVTTRVRGDIAAGIGSVVSAVTVTHDDIDPTIADNSDDDTDTVSNAPDLRITADDGGVTARAGDVVTYTLDYGNIGTQDATGSVITVTLPTGTSFNPASSTAGWVDAGGGTYTLAVGSLPTRAAGTVNFAVTVDATHPGGRTQFTLPVSIADDEANGADPNTSNNADAEDTPLDVRPDLTLTKTADSAIIAPGQTLTYTLAYANAGDQEATGVVITETLPAGTAFDAAVSDPRWTTTDGQTYTLAIGDLAAGDGGTVSFVVIVDDPVVAARELIENTARIDDDGFNGTDWTPSDNADDETVSLDARPDLVLTKTDGDATVGAGGLVTWTLSYANAGDQHATGVVLTETLPDHARFDAAASDPRWTTSDGLTYTIAIGNLDAGETGQAVFAVRLDPVVLAGVDRLDNTADLDDDGRSGATPQAASDTTPVLAVPDYVIDVDLPPIATVNDPVAVNVRIVNVGDQDGTGIVVTGSLPTDSLLITGIDAPPGVTASFDPSTGQITITKPSLAGGGTEPIDLVVQTVVKSVLPTSVEDATGRFRVTDDQSNGADPSPSNNADADAIELVVAPDYVIDISNTTELAKPRGPIDWTITVSNEGEQDGTGVVVTSQFPPEIVVNVEASHGGIVDAEAGTITWHVGDLASGQTLEFTVEGTIAGRLPRGVLQFAHVTHVTDDGAGGPDLTPRNNTDVEIDGLPTYGGYTFDSFRNESQPQWGGSSGSGMSGGTAATSYGGSGVVSSGTLSEPGSSIETGDRPRGGLFHDRPPLRIKVMPPAVSPVYSGHAEPGTTIRARIYDADGRLIGDRNVVADSGGNWLMTFPGSVIFEQPHRMDVSQTPAIYNGTETAGYNLRRFFQPTLHSTIFFAEDLTVGKVLRNTAYETVGSMHAAAEGGNHFGWVAQSYELITGEDG